MVIWKPVLGLEDRYRVSSEGQIARLRNGVLRLRKPQPMNRGYLTLQLPGPTGKFVGRTVHSVVAEAFLGGRPLNGQVNHKDGNKTNNHVSNLEWVNQRENTDHAIALGLRSRSRSGVSNFRGPLAPQKGEMNFNARLSDADVAKIRTALAMGAQGIDLAKQYGVSRALISNIRTGKRWATA